ncbi:Oxysterol-binding protein-related protein 1 [Dissostichus eleginoides]|uniref:Oxysterol-binding protein n=1 Tax=Dissostichus eleginoides TaxID=100907 RepID=A0AAD9C8Z9_DISEL|nr:Oxysterol-binding protein-related protein 1 [Dissostichus eleginoides]
MNSEEEFYDAETGLESDDSCEVSLKTPWCSKTSRKTLPAEMISRNNFSVWSILKKCIGMELSKIAMPVVFNEPLSFLQRISEYMEHTQLIHQACTLSDSIDRMQVVAAFAVSAVASQWERTGKPFNPLLGETYELMREEEGYRLISEQVSHHPPVSAFHAQSLKHEFEFHGSIDPKLKHKEAYTWTNPMCCVHNIILGKLWIEQYGTVEIINHSTGDKCVLNFKPVGMFGKELHRVEGHIQDKSKKKRRVLYGKWTECMYSIDPKVYDAHKKSEKKTAADSKKLKKMYNFTSFAMTLNEMEPETMLPPTDCRLRPDIRAMENGDMELSNSEKERLEEKQRASRRDRSVEEEEWCTRWFQLGTNPHTGAEDWLYSGGYFDRNYSDSPNIY